MQAQSPLISIDDNQIYGGKRIHLRKVRLSDCNEKYLGWLKDPEINQYLETRWSEQSLESIKEFVSSVRSSKDSHLFAIIESSTNRHIGNIKIGPIHTIYRTADVSYFIGEKDCWGRGYATEAISLCCDIAVQVLGLRRLQAGFMAGNEGSRKALERNGFRQEACFKSRILMGNNWIDHFIFARLFEGV